MKAIIKVFLTVLTVSLIFSCSRAKQSDYMESPAENAPEASVAPAPQSESEDNGFVSSSAASTKNDQGRKFVRTADMKFRVDKVIKATYQIENIVSGFDGFVTYTNLTSNINNQTVTSVSADSSLETIYFTVSNTMTVRVPNVNLDSTLRTIAKLIDYLDYRTIAASDVSLEMLSNQLAQNRVKKHEERLKTAIDERGKKLNETSDAEENLYYKQEEADNAKISNMHLQDQISYSTINLTIYQRQETKRWLIANDKNIDEYKPGLGSSLLESLKTGWKILEWLLIFVVKLWGIILFCALMYYLIIKIIQLIKRIRTKKQ